MAAYPTLFVSRRTIVRWTVACLTIATVLVAAANLLGYSGVERFSADLAPALDPEPTGRTREVAWSFPFYDRRVMVTVTLDEAEIAGGAGIDTSNVFGSRGWLRDEYVSRLVSAEAASPAIERLTSEFRRVRSDFALDDDQYLELMVTAIQTIPYGEVGPEIKLPAEVLAAGSGVCTEKSVLLAAVLVHEGYDTVLWIFPTQRHVALGVRSDRAQFRESGYAFIETTTEAFVGQAEARYRSNGPVARPPRQIALGGWRSYGAGQQVEYILGVLDRNQRVSTRTARYTSWARSGGMHREQFAERAREYWAASATAAFILGNTSDRAGVYRLLTDGAADAGSPELVF